jgi:hypothetical protein
LMAATALWEEADIDYDADAITPPPPIAAREYGALHEYATMKRYEWKH